MYAIFPFTIIILLFLIIFIRRFFTKKISSKLSIRLMGVYGLILLLSPFLAAFVSDSIPEESEIREPPENYYRNILENYETFRLEELKEDDYLTLLKETVIPISIEDFSEEQPFVISPTRMDDLDWYDRDYNHTIILEPTDKVNDIIITQFYQRTFIQGYEITGNFAPWTWKLDQWAQNKGRLKSIINRSEINLYNLTPPIFALQFDEEMQNKGFVDGKIPSLTIGTINWIQIPKDLAFRFQGSEPHRLIE